MKLGGTSSTLLPSKSPAKKSPRVRKSPIKAKRAESPDSRSSGISLYSLVLKKKDATKEGKKPTKDQRKPVVKQILDKAKRGHGHLPHTTRPPESREKTKSPGRKRKDEHKISSTVKSQSSGKESQPQSKLNIASVRKGVVHRRQFVIPTKSCRSARRIKPNRRFLSTEEVYSDVTSQQVLPCSTTNQPLQETATSNIDPPKGLEAEAPGSIPATHLTGLEFHPKVSLFDQPLVVEGKRERKPSLKLIRKLTDEVRVGKTATTGSSEGHKIKSPRTVEDEVGSATQTILQKAKFSLNQAALNRSKAALARSLKAKMRKEEKRKRKQQKVQKEEKETPVPEPEAVPSTSAVNQTEGSMFEFLPLGSPGFKPLSPVKFSSLSRETAVFGLSSLPAGEFNEVCFAAPVLMVLFAFYSKTLF